ncbi:MAG: sensor histidine kinase [Burkholderiales bacterium]|nr:sensor histidine kinase [Burkholderiales bacterium]
MATTRLTRAYQMQIARYWRVLFVAMLLLLHLTAMRGVEDIWARALMLAHFGLFILWQPFMRGEQSLTPKQLGVVVLVCVLVLFFWNWWLMLLWLCILAGVVGGKVFAFQERWQRYFHLTVLLYLVSLLLIWVFPMLLPAFTQAPELTQFAEYGLPLLFLILLFLPAKGETSDTPQVVDFFYSAFLFMIIALLVLGSFAFMTLGRLSYPVALTYSLLVLAAILLLLGLAWNPRAGFSGLGTLFSRYLLSVGLPFEQWLYFLAGLSQAEAQPEKFLSQACAGLGKLPWVSGGAWRSSAYSGEFGQPSRNTVEYADRELNLRVYTQYSLSPALTWHFNLLGQMLGEFYTAKLREQKLQQQSYMQAVYETGARMTHDVKNLLQSLNVLCAAAEQDSDRSEELQALMRRQLPVIAQRLQNTLDKLRQPQSDNSSQVQARSWWQGLQRSYAGQKVEFGAGEIGDQVLLPGELFDSAADNLIQNALGKRRQQGEFAINVSFTCSEAVRLEIRDAGHAIAREVAAELLRGPVPSDSGFGIGLYQVARQAEACGYALELAHNAEGRVSFVLSGPLNPAARPPAA